MFGLSTIAMEGIAAAVVALLIFGGGMKLQGDIDTGKYEKLELSYKDAQAQAVKDAVTKQQALDSIATIAATQDAQQQSDRANLLAKELANAQAHLSIPKITASCVPYGFVRVLYAGSHGVSTDSLSLPAGKSDDACAPIGWAELATAILHDYGQANANAGQLNSLIGLLMKEKK
jgi:hypothetical protein